MAVAITSSPSTSPQSANPLFEVRMMLPRSYRVEIKANKAVAPSRSHGHTPNSSMISTLGGQVHPHPAIQPVLALCPPQVLQKVVSPDEVHPVSVFDRPEPERHCQMGLTHPGWPKQDHVRRIGHKRHCRQFSHLTLVDGRLEVEVLQCLSEREVSQAGAGGEVPLPSSSGLDPEEVHQEFGIRNLFLPSRLQPGLQHRSRGEAQLFQVLSRLGHSDSMGPWCSTPPARGGTRAGWPKRSWRTWRGCREQR